jgi:hypothetical protein
VWSWDQRRGQSAQAPVSLAVLTEELRTRYRRGYRVLSDSSSRDALEHPSAPAGAGERSR